LTGQYFSAAFYFYINETVGDIYVRNTLASDSTLTYTVNNDTILLLKFLPKTKNNTLFILLMKIFYWNMPFQLSGILLFEWNFHYLKSGTKLIQEFKNPLYRAK